ncbi:MAG: hypothetical protein ACKOFM_05745, partial [Actinomycetota bacterium]
MNEFILQNLNLPRENTTEPLLYVRSDGDVPVVGEQAVLRKGAELSFDTSFGVFAAGRWRRLTKIHDLAVTVVASGSGRIEVVGVIESMFGLRSVETVVASANIESSGTTKVEIPNFAAANHGTYFVRVSAEQGDVTVSRGFWSTRTLAAREVRLSLSITTFN